MSIEAMKMALEALEADECDMVPDGAGHMVFRKESAITALRAAIAEAAMQRLTDVQQEMDCYGDGNVYRGQRSSDSQTQTIHVQEPLPGMSEMNRTIAYCAANKLRELGYSWKGKEWLALEQQKMELGKHCTYPRCQTASGCAGECTKATPPRREWVGLTDEELRKMWCECDVEKGYSIGFGRVVEAKLKEKNT